MADTTLVTIFGGAGFVGTQVVQALARHGYRIRVAVRRPDLAGHVRPLGAVGQVTPIQANIRNLDSVRRAVAGASIVINLVGVGFEKGQQNFRAINVEGAANVARAAREAGAKSLVHMSAIGADPESPSVYATSKGRGEREVLAAFPQAVILRPSLIFGPGDGFFNFMGTLLRIAPVMPLIGGSSRFQPVYVGDVAEAAVMAAEGAVKGGRVYELGGPEVVTYKALMERIMAETGRKRLLIPVPGSLMKLPATILSMLPLPPIVTPDQITLLSMDNIVSEEAQRDKRTLAAFSIAPTPMGAVLSSYLWRFRRHGEFDKSTAA
ncbi:NADH dehydrogenase [Devosia enhydra]|uniref:NADH dehydrogenase n=1 Tax=Devosia enhydra TaxID=665118 RepID=A0A1K2I2I3_9HYPH|nr:complex I NDUFA9 subunit family protein [Devosia enhydra]SFZ86544.1 NADH dehydrogenase [Devosia enhydra]